MKETVAVLRAAGLLLTTALLGCAGSLGDLPPHLKACTAYQTSICKGSGSRLDTREDQYCYCAGELRGA